MSEQQIAKLAGSIIEFQRFFRSMPEEDRQWVIQNTKDAIGIFIGAIKNREEAPLRKLFVPVEVVIPKVYGFVAAEHFVVDTSPSAKVKISELGGLFQASFLPKIEGGRINPEVLAVNKLKGDNYDCNRLLPLIGGRKRVEITLGQFFCAFAQQPNGERGPLAVSGRSTIGYVRNTNGLLCPIFGFWDGRGWCFAAYKQDDVMGGWDSEFEVLSR